MATGWASQPMEGTGGFSLLGLAVSASVREVFEAITLLNFFRFPILSISGVFMPVAHLPVWAKPLAVLSPLTHGVELFRFGLSGQAYFSSPAIPAATSVGFLALSWILAEQAFRQRANQ